MPFHIRAGVSLPAKFRESWRLKSGIGAKIAF